ncbi:DUF3168 domain-containing protein [Microbulbifer sp. HZ11]|uniref:DUF3168 domain-containing protein n=1 Tax=Microbulbifer sp. HZ11 TaxID=1453501 RepID=UPI0005B87892|nr:DUF3168 domain-containing protein [Microbulbifer sp. HZ11]
MIEQNLNTWLRTLGAATVRPLLLRKGDAVPGIVYTPVAARAPLGIDGSSRTRVDQIQVDVWAVSYREAKALANAVHGINGFAGDFFGQQVGLIETSTNFEEYDEEAHRYRVSIDLTIYT